MPHLLELFSGTGSVGRAFREIGWDVTSVDLNPKAGADYACDICDWEPPEGVHYDHIHASPPFTEFSRALTTRPRPIWGSSGNLPRFARPKTPAPRRWAHGTPSPPSGGLARPAG